MRDHAYTIEIFEAHPDVDAIEVVCYKNWKNEVRKNLLCE